MPSGFVTVKRGMLAQFSKIGALLQNVVFDIFTPFFVLLWRFSPTSVLAFGDRDGCWRDACFPLGRRH